MERNGRWTLTLRIFFLFVFSLPVVLLQHANAERGGLDVREIVGKSRSEIDKLIGEPLSCKETYQGISCKYQAGHLEEIIFIDDRADWLLLSEFDELPFEYMSIKHIGLPPAPPTVINPFRMHWQFHAGIAVISMYSAGKYISYIQVRAYTPQ